MTDELEKPPIDDKELVARTQEGDPRAFDELVVRYSPRLYGLIYHMTSNHEDTNDMMQDVFAKAYRSICNFRGNSSFYTWVHTIAVNMTINFLKKRNRRQHPSLNDPDSRIENDPDFIAAASSADPRNENAPCRNCQNPQDLRRNRALTTFLCPPPVAKLPS